MLPFCKVRLVALWVQAPSHLPPLAQRLAHRSMLAFRQSFDNVARFFDNVARFVDLAAPNGSVPAEAAADRADAPLPQNFHSSAQVGGSRAGTRRSGSDPGRAHDRGA